MGSALPASQRAFRFARPPLTGSVRRGPVMRRAVSGLLAELGSSETEVCRALQASGVAGSRGDPRGCAVARYLSAVVGADPEVSNISVGRSVVWMSRRGIRPAIRVSIPAPVRHFIMAFDAGIHPELEGSDRSGTRR